MPALRTLTFVLLSLTVVPNAAACGDCVYALTWQVMPAVIEWSCLSLLWFLYNSTFATLGRFTSVAAPSLFWATPLVVVGGILGPVGMGPLSNLPFAVPALAASVLAWMRDPEDGVQRLCLWSVRGGGLVALALFAATGIMEQRRAAAMDEADVFMKWTGTALGLSLSAKWEANEPASFPYYRKVLAQGAESSAGRVADRIARVGSATEDVPLLLAARERFEVIRYSDYALNNIDDALHRLTSIRAPKGASAATWRKLWAAKVAVQGATP